MAATTESEKEQAMGMQDDRMRAKVEKIIAPELQAGEQVVAMCSSALTGPSPWLRALFFPMAFANHPKAVVVTDRRVIIVKGSGFTGGPREVESTHPKETVKAESFVRGATWGKLVLTIGSEPLKLNVGGGFRDGAEKVFQALGGVKAAA
jgi:hypothetical protein